MPYENILFERDGPAITITINRPHRRNALSVDTINEMIAALAEANADTEARVVVISGAEDAFCAGADLKDAPDPMTPAVAHDIVGLYLDLIRAVRAVEKPVVARVNGIAVGGGCCTALACDIRIASERASFAFPFVNIGLSGADMGATYLLPRLVGYGRAAELLMTGDSIDAGVAERIGLVNRAVPHDELDAATRSLVERLASRPPLALKFTKRALYAGLDRPADAEFDFEHFAQVGCLLTEDYQEGRNAFLEKRQPAFRGR